MLILYIFVSILFHPVLGGVKQAPDFVVVGPTSAEIANPNSVFVDPVTRTLFISDTGNHRILRYRSVESITDLTQPEILVKRHFQSSPRELMRRD